ncbi:hypothetical protein H072_410 [Dactylellina haptotyla CBS 200.50]|uniref:Uncharacterized protein n=1 Tax=Dactylellina haptotyla (strain CBS 200.50) TaxID=1284197 RepID=S8AX70_DACHA|nr:hypothetical protein H072_410 [Dactylellina haptotyla CBS 200.50]
MAQNAVRQSSSYPCLYSSQDSSSSTSDPSARYNGHAPTDDFRGANEMISSPELMPTGDLDYDAHRRPDKQQKPIKTTTTGLLRRHTVSSTEPPRGVPTRKRAYDESCDPDNETRRLFQRIKIARKAACPSEDYKPGQKIEFLDLPSELLASIVVFVIESPPPGEYPFLSKTAFSQNHGPVRRWTLDNTPRLQENTQLNLNSIFYTDSQENRYETCQYKDEAFYPSRMLNSIASTCHKMRKLVRLKEWDVQFWRPAARLYYHLTYYPKVLPDSLDLIQGFLPTNQTSWRNFLTCTVQYIDTRKRGVESFGTKAGCKLAIPWKEYQVTLRQDRRHPPHPHNLMMLCRQPGPDLFDISWNAATESYTIAMGLNGGKSYASVDKKGNFTRGEELARNLMRSVRGLFPADILEVKNDRFSVIKIGARSFDTTSNDRLHPISTFQPVLQWNLSCVPEVRQDEKARIARCASWDKYLCFTLFKQNFADPTAPFLDPQEDSMVYCIKTTETESTANSSSNHLQTFKTELGWSHNFSLEEEAGQEGKKIEPAVCQIALSPSYAAILLRWNSTSVVKHIVDAKRQLYIFDLQTGRIVRRFNLPAFEWDFRHNDMGDEYNQIRLNKLRALYDDTQAVHRATRVHDDKLVLLESDSDGSGRPHSAKIITGSHDYCNWVWDLNQESDEEPLIVLDDFYWNTDTNEQQQQTPKKSKNKWNKFKERAGWWCSTPNQVLDFWHDFSITPDGRFFAAIRAGRTFLWDLSEERPTIKGYTSEFDDDDTISSSSQSNSRGDQSLERYLGRPTTACGHRHGHSFLRWFEYKDRIPEQGLWMVFDDWSVVYLDRNDILGACGLSHREWIFCEREFESINASGSATRSINADTEEDESSTDTDMEE